MEGTALKRVAAGITSNHQVRYTEDAADWV